MIETPRGNRVHIAIYGRTNAGKSSLINKITNQKRVLRICRTLFVCKYINV